MSEWPAQKPNTARTYVVSCSPMPQDMFGNMAKLDAWSKARRGREEGAYWVKWHKDAIWVIAQWAGCSWFVVNTKGAFADVSFAAIDERCILPPGEMK